MLVDLVLPLVLVIVPLIWPAIMNAVSADGRIRRRIRHLAEAVQHLPDGSPARARMEAMLEREAERLARIAEQRQARIDRREERLDRWRDVLPRKSRRTLFLRDRQLPGYSPKQREGLQALLQDLAALERSRSRRAFWVVTAAALANAAASLATGGAWSITNLFPG